MIVIIEGADGTGKTTLANKLAKDLKCEVVHRTHVTDTPKSQLVDIYKELILEYSDKTVVLDRAWYSEMCYGPIFRGKSHISQEAMLELEALVKATGGLIIYCSAPNSFELSQTRGEDYVTSKTQHDAVCELYENVFKEQPHELVVLEWHLTEA